MLPLIPKNNSTSISDILPKTDLYLSILNYSRYSKITEDSYKSIGLLTNVKWDDKYKKDWKTRSRVQSNSSGSVGERVLTQIYKQTTQLLKHFDVKYKKNPRMS